MKKLVPAMLTLFGYANAFAQSPDLVWVKQISGPNAETPVSIDLDSSGNIYTSGYFEGLVDFDPGPQTYTMVSPGVVSLYISKHDPQGNLLWAKQVSTPVPMANAVAHPNSQVVFKNGDVCVAGFFTGAFDFDPGTGSYYMGSANENAFVIRLDKNGQLLWARQWGSTGTDMVNGIAADGTGAIFTTGFFTDTVDFDQGVPTFTLATNFKNSSEAFIAKLDGSGNVIWVKKLGSTSGGTSANMGNDITLDAGGAIYCTGTFIGSADFDPGTGYSPITSMNDQDIFVWKLDPSGNFLWAKTMGGSSKEGGLSIFADVTGDVCVGGFFTGTCDFDPGPGTNTLTSAGDEDLFVLKMDAQGNVLWIHGTGGTGSDVVTAVKADNSGGLYCTGHFSGTVDFDGGAGTYTLSTVATNPFIGRFDAQGNITWVKHLWGTAFSAGSDIALDNSENVFTVGIFSVTVDFDPNKAVSTLTAAGEVDGYMHRMNCGVPPRISATSSASLLCAGEAATLTPSGAFTYSWNTMAGNNLTIHPASTTQYTLLGQDQKGCTSELIVTQDVENCAGLSDPPGGTSVLVYPNPNNGTFAITLLQSCQIKIFDSAGLLVHTKQAQTSSSELTFTDFPGGIYFMEVTGGHKKRVVKLIIQ